MAKQKKRAQSETATGMSGVAEFERFNPLTIEAQNDAELPQFNFILRVVNPFKGYKKASEIRNPLLIQAVIDEGDLCNCVKVLITSEE